MKIVKRDGRTVEYDADKIRIAISKANNEVSECERISDEDISSIIEYIESFGKKRMLVEDIQDIIEEKLMQKGKYHLAKTYIIYRYKRSVIRQSNTIDASILSILKSSTFGSKTYLEANRQRDIMAGEVSKDLAYRLLLPRNVVKATEEGKIEFLNVEYFTEPTIESAKIDLQNMLENGTVINGIMVEPPKSFQSACNILVEIVIAVASCQTGKIYIELKSLFKYYYLSYDKVYGKYKTLLKDSLSDEQIRAMSHTQVFAEVKTGIQTILYQINTFVTGKGTTPKVCFMIDTRDIESLEEERIVYEFIKQKTEGIKSQDNTLIVTEYPIIVYSLPEGKSESQKYGYMSSELLMSKCKSIFMSEKRYESFLKEIEKFNQGSVAIDLAKIASQSENDRERFLHLLEENLNYCYEGLSCRNHNLQGIYSNKSPIHWQYGGIARLGEMERIDRLLKKNYSVMTLVVCGFEVALKMLCGDGDYKKHVKKMIVDMVAYWNRENSFEIVISNDASECKNYDVELYKKYDSPDSMDSFQFMVEDYFKDGMLYVGKVDGFDIVNEEILNKNFIMIKDFQND